MGSASDLHTNVLLRSERSGGHVSMMENVVSVCSAGPAPAHASHSDADARYLLVCTLAGLERLFARTAAASPGAEPPEWTLQPSPEINVVGPQIAREG
jgi:hypothetical protein